jgi:UPF0755 protein
MRRSERVPWSIGRKLVAGLWVGAGLLVVISLVYASAFGPVWRDGKIEQFLVTPDDSLEMVAEKLTSAGYVRAPWIFKVAYLRESYGKNIRPGGYEISKTMDAWSIASALVEAPKVAWVRVPVGMRKEEIGSLLARELGWNDEAREAWRVATASTSPNYIEGVYFPDTYLIPTDEDPAAIADRMRTRFKEAFAPYAEEALAKKVPWTRVLTIASLIQREAGGASDMPIISGIIQKRLASGMPLALDATLQYMEGNEEAGWWKPPRAAGTYPDSPFNTYKRAGLPPHAIASPGLAAIEAALNPVATNCLFYLHDAKGQIHCSPSYSGHLANIRKYLR